MGHTLKGNRVRYLGQGDIHETARRFCRYLRINKTTAADFPSFLENLGLLNICLDPVEDEEWLDFTEAACDPATFRIMLPNRSYVAACRGDHAAISTIFHEIGHLVLGHKPILHKAGNSPPVKEEDAEWQADEFAAFVVRYMGLAPWQLSLDFGDWKWK